MNAMDREVAFTGALHAWDNHVDACSVCLVEGTTLCYEGQHRSDEVVGLRESIGAAQIEAETQHPTSMPQRLPSTRGVAA